MTDRRLIEESFPLKEVSENSKHEKNVRHGHISTLHIWPARRPLAACRAAIIAALMPDPGNEADRHDLNKKIISISKWKNENGPALDYFRQEIRNAYGGRAPKVLDMFAGGGAIPLEAMRLGCDVTAIDYNPVAWFILKCTLEFPQKLSGKTWPLPADETIRAKLKIQRSIDDEGTSFSEDGIDGKTSEGEEEDSGNGVHEQLELLSSVSEGESAEGSLVDHIRYWGEWVLQRARKDLESYYPTVNGKPTIAYLWARTVPCSDPKCGCEVPLLKTLWLCKKLEKTLPDTPTNRARPDFLRIQRTKNTSRVVINAMRALRIVPPSKGEGGKVRFVIWAPTPNDDIPDGTMSGASCRCPSCGINLTPNYLKECGWANKLGAQMTAIVIDAGGFKDYLTSSPNDEELAIASSKAALEKLSQQIPYGIPKESQARNPRTFVVQLYGMTNWDDIYTSRQMLTLCTFVKWVLEAQKEIRNSEYGEEYLEATVCYLASAFDKLADYCSTICVWELQGEEVKHTFQRYALPMTWDFAECNPLAEVDRYYIGGLNSVIRVLENLQLSKHWGTVPRPSVLRQSAKESLNKRFDLIVTDPPYYDAIPYADISDFFYIWLRRIIGGLFPGVFSELLTKKDDELALRLPHVDIPDERTPEWFENGMATAFRRGWESLVDDGRMVIVFAHKDPAAWETLASALINSGFTVIGSWPIDTEMTGGVRNLNRASLSSSIWLVCRKRPENTGAGRYRNVRKAMEERVIERLRYFWDIGLSGPDFVWAAVGPALESYSSYSEVKRMDGSVFTVREFLKEVRRMVSDFALGQILKGYSTEGLDEWTRYYLIHRSNFGLTDAPVGECILFTQGYGIDLNDLRSDRGYISKGSGNDVRLAKWDERVRDDLGQPHPSGGLPIIDSLHRLMHLWAAGTLDRFNQYVAEHGLRQNELFWAVGQAVLEMAEPKSRERTLLEAIVAWGRGKSPEEHSTQETLLSEVNDGQSS